MQGLGIAAGHQQDVPQPSKVLRLLPLEPQYLGCCEARHELMFKFDGQLPGFHFGLHVAPQLGWPDDLP